MENDLMEKRKESPIWLVGDSYPSRSLSVLNGPLDPRHPTRHTIWTPIWDAIQESVYPRRVDEQHLFICNAAEKQEIGEANKDFNDSVVITRVNEFSKDLARYEPAMVLCFGAWAYEFVRRANKFEPTKRYDRHWTVKELGEAFRKSCELFQPSATSIFPLLHRIVAVQWEHATDNFVPEQSGDYFKYTGSELAKLLTTHSDSLKLKVIWKPTQKPDRSDALRTT